MQQGIISILLGYALGCFQTSFILAKLIKKIDIREHGSGNAGSTNALRVLGPKIGFLTFIGDFAKAVIAVIIARMLFGSQLAGLYAGLGVVLGHNWPVVLGFRGGKGIASTLGIICAFDWRIGLTVWAICAIVILITRYVSLGSLLMVTMFPLSILIIYPGRIQESLIAFGLMGMALWRHRGNIKRLLAGEENKLGRKRPPAEEAEPSHTEEVQ